MESRVSENATPQAVRAPPHRDLGRDRERRAVDYADRILQLVRGVGARSIGGEGDTVRSLSPRQDKRDDISALLSNLDSLPRRR